jgi:hypothetical protein
MLKAELMAPAAADGLLADQLAAKYVVAADAAEALQQTIAALGPSLLDTQVLSDVAVDDLQEYLGLVNPPWSNVTSDESAAGAAAWDLPEKAQRRLACIAKIVAAVSKQGSSTVRACTHMYAFSVCSPTAVTADCSDSCINLLAANHCCFGCLLQVKLTNPTCACRSVCMLYIWCTAMCLYLLKVHTS